MLLSLMPSRLAGVYEIWQRERSEILEALRSGSRTRNPRKEGLMEDSTSIRRADEGLLHC